MTFDIPFVAIAAGRNRLGLALAEIGIWRPLAAILAYAAAFHLNGRLGAAAHVTGVRRQRGASELGGSSGNWVGHQTFSVWQE